MVMTRKQAYNLLAGVLYNGIQDFREENPSLALTNEEVVGVLDVLKEFYRDQTSIDMVNRMVFREMNRGDDS
jgi:hypothetical protein